MVTTYVLFAFYMFGNGVNGEYSHDFGSQGACEMALAEGIRQNIFKRGFCTPKG